MRVPYFAPKRSCEGRSILFWHGCDRLGILRRDIRSPGCPCCLQTALMWPLTQHSGTQAFVCDCAAVNPPLSCSGHSTASSVVPWKPSKASNQGIWQGWVKKQRISNSISYKRKKTKYIGNTHRDLHLFLFESLLSMTCVYICFLVGKRNQGMLTLNPRTKSNYFVWRGNPTPSRCNGQAILVLESSIRVFLLVILSIKHNACKTCILFIASRNMHRIYSGQFLFLRTLCDDSIRGCKYQAPQGL